MNPIRNIIIIYLFFDFSFCANGISYLAPSKLNFDSFFVTSNSISQGKTRKLGKRHYISVGEVIDKNGTPSLVSYISRKNKISGNLQTMKFFDLSDNEIGWVSFEIIGTTLFIIGQKIHIKQRGKGYSKLMLEYLIRIGLSSNLNIETGVIRKPLLAKLLLSLGFEQTSKGHKVYLNTKPKGKSVEIYDPYNTIRPINFNTQGMINVFQQPIHSMELRIGIRYRLRKFIKLFEQGTSTYKFVIYSRSKVNPVLYVRRNPASKSV